MDFRAEFKKLKNSLRIPTVIVGSDGSATGLMFRGVNIAGTQTNATPDLFPSATTSDHEVRKATSIGQRGVFYQCDPTADAWAVLNGVAVIYKLPAPIEVTAPAVQASAVASNGGNLQVTATAHGLTGGTVVGSSVYVSAGTGWTAGLYEILSVDSVNTYTLNVARGTLGVPTVALANGTDELTLLTMAGPPLLSSSSLTGSIGAECSGQNTNTKRIIFDFSTARVFNANMSLSTDFGVYGNFTVKNLGSTSSQKTMMPVSILTGYARLTSAPVSSSINTAAAYSMYVRAILGAANDIITLNEVDLMVRM